MITSRSQGLAVARTGTHRVMQIALFIAVWLIIWLGVPALLHVLIGGSAYPLVTLSAVVSFVAGALIAAWATGLFKATSRPE